MFPTVCPTGGFAELDAARRSSRAASNTAAPACATVQWCGKVRGTIPQWTGPQRKLPRPKTSAATASKQGREAQRRSIAWLGHGQARLRRPKAEGPRGDGLACLCGETEGNAELEELQPQLARPIVRRCGNDATRQRHYDVCIKGYGNAVVSLTTKHPFRPPNPKRRRAKPRVIATAWYPARNGIRQRRACCCKMCTARR